MNEQQRKPLILVVDDVPEYRESLLPRLVEAIGCRVCKASNVQEAAIEASRHGPKSSDPLDLVILDMHLPLDAMSATVAEDDGGIQFLLGYRFYRCPVVVFTAYPSYRDCVVAMKAGATDYILKVRVGNEGGPDALREACERILKPTQGTEDAIPTRSWIEENHQWLGARYRGKWVAFVDKALGEHAKLQVDAERDGVLLLAGDSYEDVRERIQTSPEVLRSRPSLLLVQ